PSMPGFVTLSCESVLRDRRFAMAHRAPDRLLFGQLDAGTREISMNFTHYNLGHVERGSVVVVTLSGSAANVRLMDGSNFNSYKAGRRHSYVGGLAKRSPVRLPVPRSGTWHVAIDMQGFRGSVRSGVQVVPGAALT